MAEVILLLSTAHFLESHGTSYNAQLVIPTQGERERGAGTSVDALRPLYMLLPLTSISLMT